MTKPWQTKEWRTRRAEFIKGKSCEWCGSTEFLTIDHKENFYPNRERGRLAYALMVKYFEGGQHADEAQAIADLAVKQFVAGGGILREYNACPSCGYCVQPRKYKRPKYKCYQCHLVFDEPLRKWTPSTIRLLDKLFFKEFCLRHGKDIDAEFIPLWKQLNQGYLEFKEVLVLCRRCAYARKKGLILCKVCRKRYHKPIYSCCFNCFLSNVKKKLDAKRFEVDL